MCAHRRDRADLRRRGASGLRLSNGAWRLTEHSQPIAPHTPCVTDTHGDAGAVEEFQHLDRDLSAVVEPVTKLRRGQHSGRIGSGDVRRNAGHFRYRLAEEELIRRDLDHAPHALHPLQRGAHRCFGHRQRVCQVARTRWAKAIRGDELRTFCQTRSSCADSVARWVGRRSQARPVPICGHETAPR